MLSGYCKASRGDIHLILVKMEHPSQDVHKRTNVYECDSPFLWIDLGWKLRQVS